MKNFDDWANDLTDYVRAKKERDVQDKFITEIQKCLNPYLPDTNKKKMNEDLSVEESKNFIYDMFKYKLYLYLCKKEIEATCITDQQNRVHTKYKP